MAPWADTNASIPARAPARTYAFVALWLLSMAVIPALLIDRGMLVAAVALLAVGVVPLLAPYALTWRRLLYGVILTVLVVPASIYRLPSALPVGIDVYRLATLALLALWGAALLVDRRIRLRSTPLDGPLFALMSLIGISMLVNLPDLMTVGLAEAVKRGFYVASLILLLYAIVSIVREEGEARRLVGFVIGVVTVISVFAVLERLTGTNVFRQLHKVIPLLRPSEAALAGIPLVRAGGVRVSGSAGHPIAFSAILAMIEPLALARLAVAEGIRQRAMYAASAALMAIAMILTGSRTAFIALMVLAAVLLLGDKQGAKRLLPTLGVVMVAVYIAFPGMLGTMFKWLSPSFINQQESGNMAGRIADYPRVRAYFALRPAFGMGFGVFSPDRYFYLDNQFLKFLVELGALGLAAYVWLFAAAGRWMYSVSKRVRSVSKAGADLLGITASIAVFFVVNATFDTFGFPQVAYVFFVLLGIGGALALTSEKAAGTSAEPKPDRGAGTV